MISGLVLTALVFSEPVLAVDAPAEGAEDFYLIDDSRARARDPDRYFSQEIRRVVDRRTAIGGPAWAASSDRVGIGLSGGGIRSAAVQLGILSGLSSFRVRIISGESSAVDLVDYLSGVSGGSWAMGAYWIAGSSRSEFFKCLDQFALTGSSANGSSCSWAPDVLRNDQSVFFGENNTKEKWEEAIRDSYIPSDCREFQFSDLKSDCWKATKKKPYVIFNLTHSTLAPTKWGANLANLPFQITPDYLGTVVDCGSTYPEDGGCGGLKGANAGKGNIGFMARQGSSDYKWFRNKRSALTAWLIKKREPGAHLSKAMGHSSAVVGGPKLLSFSMALRQRGDAVRSIRDNYFISDGGWVENLGLLALVERRVSIVILSDAGHASPNEDSLADLRVAESQVRKLLGCELDGAATYEEAKVLNAFSYKCPGEAGSAGYGGRVAYLKPRQNNIGDFLEYLRLENKELYKCVTDDRKVCYGDAPSEETLEAENRFPQTDTFMMRYDGRLIRTYYLLGRYLAITKVGPEICLQLGAKCQEAVSGD